MKESNILKLIQIEASKNGCIPIRINSGKFWQGKLISKNGEIIIHNARAIAGAPEGTADLLVIAPHGRTIWIETKTKLGHQRKSQKRFENAITELEHEYYVIKTVDEFREILHKFN